MGRAIIFNDYGDSGVLQLADIDVKQPEANEVLIKQQAVSVNYHDILYRSGRRKIDQNQSMVLGFGAAGVVEAVGSDVKHLQKGQKVAYALAPIGSYTEYRCVNQSYIIAVPDELSVKDVAACFFKGMMAHAMLFRAYAVREGDTLLVHSAASGVGYFITRWASSVGVRVIGTVGEEFKKEVALAAGCVAVFNRQTEDWVQGVKSLTEGKGVYVAFDGIGKDTADKTIDALARFGMITLYGESSGMVQNIDITKLMTKSLFLTTPSLFHYKAMKHELLLSSNEIFSKMLAGHFSDSIGASFKLEDAAKAHNLLESKRSIKSVILEI